ncbi:ATP-binding protein [Floccifex sp.]|uniref:ATP-binding protein n=1 Tax=Floccifex sp. TaxID=2815810 RepID=UPI003F0306F8
MKYLQDHFFVFFEILFGLIILFVVFYLYRLPFEAFMYLFLIFFMELILVGIYDFSKYRKKVNDIHQLKDADTLCIQSATNLEKECLNSFLVREQHLKKEKEELKEQLNAIEQYYMIWTHQMKLPIAAMKLLLESDEIDKEACKSQLLRMDQNTDMVLAFIRMNSEQSDYLFQFYDLDDMIRQAIRYFAHECILINLSMDFESTHKSILTDEKWFVFVLEQILSNAIKYSFKNGCIHIYFEKDSLVIEDHGCGIDASDLPRIFEKGFTGYNGRMDKKASGLGLFLCKGICDSLSHQISIDSKVNQGTRVYITFLLDSCKENR